ncbi:hypothetical protein KL932_004391 [Ogataea haglerorum]|nr:hypothetical protein KL932_004391 [Ogataea haglerorum]
MMPVIAPSSTAYADITLMNTPAVDSSCHGWIRIEMHSPRYAPRRSVRNLGNSPEKSMPAENALSTAPHQRHHRPVEQNRHRLPDERVARAARKPVEVRLVRQPHGNRADRRLDPRHDRPALVPRALRLRRLRQQRARPVRSLQAVHHHPEQRRPRHHVQRRQQPRRLLRRHVDHPAHQHAVDHKPDKLLRLHVRARRHRVLHVLVPRRQRRQHHRDAQAPRPRLRRQPHNPQHDPLRDRHVRPAHAPHAPAEHRVPNVVLRPDLPVQNRHRADDHPPDHVRHHRHPHRVPDRNQRRAYLVVRDAQVVDRPEAHERPHVPRPPPRRQRHQVVVDPPRRTNARPTALHLQRLPQSYEVHHYDPKVNNRRPIYGISI